MTVHVASPLRSYTGNRASVEAAGATLKELLADLDRQFPGMRFRMIDEQDQIRAHIKLFVGTEQAREITASLEGAAEVHIICAISGGMLVRDPYARNPPAPDRGVGRPDTEHGTP